MKNPTTFPSLLATKLTSCILVVLFSSLLVSAQNSPKKSKSSASASKKVEVKEKAIPSHRHTVKGKQKKHSKYQGDIEANN